jgi:hypothetical protein
MFRLDKSSLKKEKMETTYLSYKMGDSLAKKKGFLIFSKNTNKDKYLER